MAIGKLLDLFVELEINSTYFTFKPLQKILNVLETDTTFLSSFFKLSNSSFAFDGKLGISKI